MKIKYVTLTGADDSVEPKDMAILSDKFKFVEWGILFSQSKSGVTRYPSNDWVLKLLNNNFNLAAHLCGKWVDDALNGEITFLNNSRMHCFNRIQLNMGKDRLQLAMTSNGLKQAVAKVNKPVIFGGNYKYINVTSDFFILLYPLFDCSGGRGILNDWSKPFIDKDGKALFCGYAGGLGPENIAEELKKIDNIVGDATIWIDMESKLRTDNRFDLDKCEQVLQIAKLYG